MARKASEKKYPGIDFGRRTDGRRRTGQGAFHALHPSGRPLSERIFQGHVCTCRTFR